MKRLYLVRHGVALPHGTPDIPDDDRKLTHKGEARVVQIARGLRRLKVEVDRVVSSPLPRALRTAEILADGLGFDDRMETSDALRPGASAGSIRDWLGSRSEERLMLVGHNPNLSELLGVLVGLPDGRTLCELKKAGVAALRDDGDGTFRVQWLSTPRLIRRLTD